MLLKTKIKLSLDYLHKYWINPKSWGVTNNNKDLTSETSTSLHLIVKSLKMQALLQSSKAQLSIALCKRKVCLVMARKSGKPLILNWSFYRIGQKAWTQLWRSKECKIAGELAVSWPEKCHSPQKRLKTTSSKTTSSKQKQQPPLSSISILTPMLWVAPKRCHFFKGK